MAFAFLEVEEEDPKYALNSSIASFSDAWVDGHSKRLNKCLNARCRDLIEVNTDGYNYASTSYLQTHRVDFLHRTVKDFFLNTKA